MEFDWSLQLDGGCYINDQWEPFPNGYCRVNLQGGAQLRLSVLLWRETGLYRWSGYYYDSPGAYIPADIEIGEGLPTIADACRAAESWAANFRPNV